MKPIEPEFNQDQLRQIVAEVDRLAQKQRTNLTVAEVRQILEELNLPSGLLEQAVIECQRRAALAKQQRNRRWRILAFSALALLVIGGAVWLSQREQHVLSQVTAQSSRIFLGGTPMDSSPFPRQRPGEILYQVTLRQAPIGRRLSLSCQWSAPNGEVMKQNHFHTREITTTPWNTHCRWSPPPSLPTGTWTVRMQLGERLLSEQSFEVR